jgi:hypothetical protein
MRGYMDFYLKAPKWNDKKCPNTSKDAAPIKFRAVKDVTVIKLSKAKYRGSEFSGTFLVMNGSNIKELKSGKGKKKVFCLWFGHQIKTECPEFTFDLGDAEVIENYKGKVVTDIASPKK